MDLIPVEVEEAIDAGDGKKRKAAGATRGGKDMFKNMLEESEGLQALVKLSLSSAQKLRTVFAAVFLVFKIPVAGEWFKAMTDATKAYTQAVKLLKEKKGLNADQCKKEVGIPHIHGFNGMVKHMGTQLQEEERPLLKKMFEGMTWQQVNLVVKVCRIEKMFSGTHKRLVLHCPMAQADPELMKGVFGPMSEWQVHHVYAKLVHMLRQDKSVEEMEGIAPSGDQERKLQNLLDAEKD
mmetsp:Transcript_97631/g.154452  ORF Transcript_97631/g.154452 Transcript_97631/m.154452 type:complete len:237 (-) Transcript_97631:242-952(-)